MSDGTMINPDFRICIIGEGMLELSQTQGDWHLGYGGDTINTAVHLARSGRAVSYASALGGDNLSQTVRRSWDAEGVDTRPTLIADDRLPGLYVIETDLHGERSFHYWRSESAARAMFDLPDADTIFEAVRSADLIYYSLITLAILAEPAREKLFSLCADVRARGGLVAFDGNYRARLWPDATAARAARDRAIACCDIGLPTHADEVAMGELDDPCLTATRWRAAGMREVAIKLGAQGCLITDTIVPPPRNVAVVDSSGAGDAFNAGYLNARLAGVDEKAAAMAGHRLAGWVIGHRGAIPERTPDAPYIF